MVPRLKSYAHYFLFVFVYLFFIFYWEARKNYKKYMFHQFNLFPYSWFLIFCFFFFSEITYLSSNINKVME